MHADPEALRRIFDTCHTIAVVGLSANPERASYEVASYMQEHGYRVVPVNPGLAASGATVLGEKCYANLTDIAFAVDMVNVFRPTPDVEPFAHQAIAIGARCFWQQLGISNAKAVELVREAGLDSVDNHCFLVEHRRLRGEEVWGGVPVQARSPRWSAVRASSLQQRTRK